MEKSNLSIIVDLPSIPPSPNSESFKSAPSTPSTPPTQKKIVKKKGRCPIAPFVVLFVICCVAFYIFVL